MRAGAGRPVLRADSVTAGNGTDMTFDASRSAAPGGVAQFSWQFNAILNADTVEQTTPTTTYTFPAPGAYSTGVAVFKGDGLSTGTGGIVVTGKNGFQPAFTVSQGAGTTVSFSALTTVSGKPVINYLWEFGDGTTGSGPAPTHTYQRAGTYTVTAVLFSGVGSAFPGDGAGPIYQQKIAVG
jgi:PKD repeat protein